ncbi:hypothetical protein [Desulfocurvibacter africanus]|uniref:hypothetical protein n=1 Tax=Desulfocurvibacter africanus TaxID=873 RepID=UPI000414326F|nr:hypothetical protein [Desulfocurvibacter africanus]
MSILLPKRSGRSAGTSLVRLLGLALVFLFVAWAFWQNNERAIERIKSNQAISDATGTLGGEDLESVRSFARILEERYGLKFRLQVVADVLKVPEQDPRTLYIGLNPETRLVVLEVPGLVANALGQEFLRYLREAHFEQYWNGPGWPEGLKSALALILERLEAVNGHG